jgi:hypothetical protein
MAKGNKKVRVQEQPVVYLYSSANIPKEHIQTEDCTQFVEGLCGLGGQGLLLVSMYWNEPANSYTCIFVKTGILMPDAPPGTIIPINPGLIGPNGRHLS